MHRFQKPISDSSCHPSPKVQQRINFRRIHLPDQGGGESDGGAFAAASADGTTVTGGAGGVLSSTDVGGEMPGTASIGADDGRESLASSTPAIVDGRRKPVRSLSRSRLFKGSKIRSCAAAIGEGPAPLRLPVLDHGGRDSLTSGEESTFDESDEDDVGVYPWP